MATIKLTNNTLLTSDSINGIKGVDKDVVLFQAVDNVNTVNWTATEDGWVFARKSEWEIGQTQLNIDGVEILFNAFNYGYAQNPYMTPIKKGQVLTNLGSTRKNIITVFGLK